MKYLLPVLFGGSAGFLFDSSHHWERKAQALDTITGGYDKHLRAELATTNGTSALRTLGKALFARDECDNGEVDCSEYQCDYCGSCCGGGSCAENFGVCCDEDTYCSFGFSCCSSSSCCYQDTSFCCDSSPTGCCANGTQCTPDGCVGDPDFLIESVATTTTYTSFIYSTSTVFDTTVYINFDVTTEFVTSTVTSESIDVATITNYVTSTSYITSMEIARRLVTESRKRTEHSMERRNRHSPPTPITTSDLGRFRVGLENIGLLPKRDVTSYIYDFVFVWDMESSDIFETSTVFSEVDSMSTEFYTITSTLFQDAESTTTVESTVVVTSTEVATSTELDTTSTSYDVIVVPTTFVVGVTNSGDGGVATMASIADGGDASGLQIVSGASTTRSDSSTNPSTSSDSRSRQGDLSTGAKAGIGAGAGAASLALLGALVFFVLGKRRRTASTAGDNNQQPMAPSTVADWTPPPPPPIRYSHLDSREVFYTERAAALANSMEKMRQPITTPNTPGYQQSHDFSSTSRHASPSTPSEMVGFEDQFWGAQETSSATRNTGSHMGPNEELHEMPSSPEPSYFRYSGQGGAR